MIKIEEVVERSSKYNYSEEGYLMFNPDVSQAVNDGVFRSGLDHFNSFGYRENRSQFNVDKYRRVEELRNSKYERLINYFRGDIGVEKFESKPNFLTEDFMDRFNIKPTNNVSSLGYDKQLQDIILRFSDGLILDCGSGLRKDYYSNIVNLEIVDYWSTDVLSVGEVLPFKDNTFDVVISVAVLEHVKDPFSCASEISRVLKTGGLLYSAIPFLQPFHGYPHHYYNMTFQGHRNLYHQDFKEVSLEVRDSLRPIYSLNWFLNSYLNGLKDGKVRDEFLNMRVADLIVDSNSLIRKEFVTTLSEEVNYELACGTLFIGTKK